MAVQYRRLEFASRDHEQVSLPWYVLLHDIYYEDGVRFNVNEGHRTWARQVELVREKGVWDPIRNPTGAAEPSNNAPHIRTGREDHAIDFSNIDAVIRAAARRGVTIRRTIRTEPWHAEADRAQLLAYYKRRRHLVIPRTLRPGSRGPDVRRLHILLRAVGYLPANHKVGSVFGIRVARAVKKFKKAHGLKADYRYGSGARKALERAYARKK